MGWVSQNPPLADPFFVFHFTLSIVARQGSFVPSHQEDFGKHPFNGLRSSGKIISGAEVALFIRGEKGNVEFHKENMAEALSESNGGKRNGGIEEIYSY